MKEALRFSETSVLTRATRHNIPEDTILYSHRRENLKSYIAPCSGPQCDIWTRLGNQAEQREMGESATRLYTHHLMSTKTNGTEEVQSFSDLTCQLNVKLILNVN
jgi:hypothetical protein